MEGILFAPLSITEDQARMRITRPDWPQPDDGSSSDWSPELLWIPFDRNTGEPAASLSAYPGLSMLIFDPGAIDTFGRGGSTERPVTGTMVASERRTGITCLPVWYMSRGRSSASWVAINGCNGRAVAGELETHPAAAFSHLAFYLVLTLFCCYWGSDIAITMINGSIDGAISLYTRGSGHHSISLSFAVFLAVAGISASMLITGIAFRLFPRFLQEPLCRIITGRIILPLDITKGRLLQGTALVALGEAFMNISLLMTMKDLTPLKTLFIAGDLIISLVFCLAALKCASDLGRYSPSLMTGMFAGNAIIPSSVSSDLAVTLIYIAVGSAAGSMAGYVLLHSGLWGYCLQTWAPDSMDFVSLCAEIGAFAGILPAPLVAVYRIPLIIGTLSTKLGDMLIGDWGGLVITIVMVAVSTFLVSRQKEQITGRALWHSARLSWNFCLFGTLGTLAGRIIAIFMLGIHADKLGEAVGGIISSLAGLMAGERNEQ